MLKVSNKAVNWGNQNLSDCLKINFVKIEDLIGINHDFLHSKDRLMTLSNACFVIYFLKNHLFLIEIE